jgi:hypothetical protein
MMYRERLNTLLRLTLTLALMLNIVSPPAFAHAHPGGDRAHDHQTVDSRPHSHSHDGDHRHPHAADDHITHRNQITGAIPHVHLSCFGLDFTLPIDSESDSPLHDSIEWNVGLCGEVWQSCVTVRTAYSSSAAIPIAPFIYAVNLVKLNSRLSRGFRIACHIPLCDTARFERSGVQLI